MKKWVVRISLCLAALFFLTGFKVVSRPLNGVYDETGTLSQTVIQKVENYNAQMREIKEKPQVAVMVVSSLNGESITSVANQVARQWQIGYKDTNYGALILVAINDREVRIETSDQMATIITDNTARQLINLAVTDFKAARYSDGIDKMVTGLVIRLQEGLNVTLNAELAQQKRALKLQNSSGFGLDAVLSILISVFGFIMYFLLFGSRRRNHSWMSDLIYALIFSRNVGVRRRRHDDDDDFFSGFGGRSGGGSSSWGGGNFSGGGSSGKW